MTHLFRVIVAGGMARSSLTRGHCRGGEPTGRRPRRGLGRRRWPQDIQAGRAPARYGGVLGGFASESALRESRPDASSKASTGFLH